ncbi:VOC family protein [Maritalea sp.]|uniref:VOC family protein n=1 Tax=Maritalea sp. TaxID=2003361 RepID=UPI003EF7B269
MKLDHLALGVNDLASGTKTLSEMFGVEPFGGGEHELFATHNKLWRIETPTYPIYLELIASNPDAEPKRSRWFGLGEPFASDDIALLGFIASSSDIQTAVSKPPFDALTTIDVTRGRLSWQFGITNDGALLEDGALPYLIEWHNGLHPLDGVAGQGLQLTKLWGSAIAQLDGGWPVPVLMDRCKFGFELKTGDDQIVRFER